MQNVFFLYPFYLSKINLKEEMEANQIEIINLTKMLDLCVKYNSVKDWLRNKAICLKCNFFKILIFKDVGTTNESALYRG